MPVLYMPSPIIYPALGILEILPLISKICIPESAEDSLRRCVNAIDV
jgi:hypothetical protein